MQYQLSGAQPLPQLYVIGPGFGNPESWRKNRWQPAQAGCHLYRSNPREKRR